MERLLQLDETVTNLLYLQSVEQSEQMIIFAVASVLVYLLPIVLLFLFFRSHRDRIVSIKIFTIAVLAWQVISSSVGNLIYNSTGFRERPFAQIGIDELLFEQPNKAFPSDHAAVLMAVALGFFIYKYPKLGYIFLVIAVVVGVARVVIGFHWAGDIVAGWLIGAVAVAIIWLFNRPVTNFIEWGISKLSRSYGRKTN